MEIVLEVGHSKATRLRGRQVSRARALWRSIRGRKLPSPVGYCPARDRDIVRIRCWPVCLEDIAALMELTKMKVDGECWFKVVEVE